MTARSVELQIIPVANAPIIIVTPSLVSAYFGDERERPCVVGWGLVGMVGNDNVGYIFEDGWDAS